MENWQQDHISKNLVKLISYTRCSNVLLALLLEKNILSDAEVQQLNLQNTTPSENAMQLYNIVTTRKDSYAALLRALKETQQSGAVEILENPYVKYENFTNIAFDKNNVLGEGSFGTNVYGGEFGGREVAVKVLRKQQIKASVADNEIQILLKLDDHPNIVRYFNAKEDKDLVYIVLERCAVTLQEEVHKKLINLEDVDILRKCTKGLDYLHRNNVIHGDLKPANVLLTLRKEVKISDFGVSKLMTAGSTSVTTSGVIGTLDWMAPEIIGCIDGDDPKPKLNARTDIFALGCIYFFTLTKGEHPFGKGIRIPVNIEDDRSNLDALRTKFGNH